MPKKTRVVVIDAPKPAKARKRRKEPEVNCSAADILSGNVPTNANPLAGLLGPRARRLHPPSLKWL